MKAASKYTVRNNYDDILLCFLGYLVTTINVLGRAQFWGMILRRFCLRIKKGYAIDLKQIRSARTYSLLSSIIS